MTKILNFKIIIEQDEDGVFIASVPSIPCCHSQGKTYEEVLKNIKEAIELSLEVAKEIPSYKEKIVFPEAHKKETFIGVTELPVRFVC